MRKKANNFAFSLLCVTMTILLALIPTKAADIIDRADLITVFKKHNVSGTFALYDPTQDQLTLVNSKRANIQMIPASTFKIANSLIALETNIIADENEIIPFGGKPQPIKAWEKDMPIKQAFKVSNVPVYQELARRIGIQDYNIWLKKLGYGNHTVGDNVTMFWLKGPLKISAVEQAQFIAKLAGSKLPLSMKTQQIVRNIAKIESSGNQTFYGKTGWTIAPDPNIGWFVGWVENKDNPNKLVSFALNIDINSRKDVSLREIIAREMLAKLGKY
ncbi:class D beta-lactamase [Lentilitoribacter sp. Alg239-R112]|uniref:class D beta-lactamase n=1 Tax=Lentilitoribacter sp. Alg239-R112 TaxID=2305987 RepID=UPI0013A6E7E0|nr:class D beta-lactamase [Lentilitoribacter sp. Alg239-R112]